MGAHLCASECHELTHLPEPFQIYQNSETSENLEGFPNIPQPSQGLQGNRKVARVSQGSSTTASTQESTQNMTHFGTFQTHTCNNDEKANQALNLHSSQTHLDCHSAVGQVVACVACAGANLTDYRDPLRSDGRIRTGLLDVDGNGHVDCNDLHDACFLDYPMGHPIVPDNSPNAFATLQEMYRDEVRREMEMEDHAGRIAERDIFHHSSSGGSHGNNSSKQGDKDPMLGPLNMHAPSRDPSSEGDPFLIQEFDGVLESTQEYQESCNSCSCKVMQVARPSMSWETLGVSTTSVGLRKKHSDADHRKWSV